MCMLGRAVRCFNVVDEGAHLPLSLAGSRREEALVALIQRAGTNSICYCQHWDLRGKKRTLSAKRRNAISGGCMMMMTSHFLTLSCSSMELRMISAASRAIWSWVSVTEVPWSMITTYVSTAALTAETYTGLPTHRNKDLWSTYLQNARTLHNDFSWTLMARSQV